MGEAVNLLSIIISILALLVALAALALTIGMKLSTHSIEWKPLETHQPFDDEPENKDIEEDEFLEKALNLQKKKKKLEDPMDDVFKSSNF